jgi:hypothetical protein
MPRISTAIAVVGIDIGKNSFHVVGLDRRGAIILRQKWSRSQVGQRLANMPPCLIGMEACVGAHHLSRRLKALGHDPRLMPAKYVRPYFGSKAASPAGFLRPSIRVRSTSAFGHAEDRQPRCCFVPKAVIEGERCGK